MVSSAVSRPINTASFRLQVIWMEISIHLLHEDKAAATVQIQEELGTFHG